MLIKIKEFYICSFVCEIREMNSDANLLPSWSYAGEHLSSHQIGDTCLNVNMEIITSNVVIVSGPWRNISIVRWVMFLFSGENLKNVRFLYQHISPLPQNRNRSDRSAQFFQGWMDAFFFSSDKKKTQARSSSNN